MTDKIETIYYGEHDAMMDEISSCNFKSFMSAKECKFVVQIGGNFDAEAFASRKEAKAHAAYLAKEYGAKICAV